MPIYDRERIKRVKDKIPLENLRFLYDEFGSNRVRMKKLFMEVVKLSLDEKLREHGYDLPACANSLDISLKTLYRYLHEKKARDKES
jgi:transcriptional regulator with PAS, ATPase and Fis domain